MGVAFVFPVLIPVCLLFSGSYETQRSTQFRRTLRSASAVPGQNVFDEWFRHNLNCSGGPAIDRKKASKDILNFTREFQMFYWTDLSPMDFARLKRYSYTLNKEFHILNEFPAFFRKVTPRISSFDDILFMENALDMYSILERQRLELMEKIYRYVENLAAPADIESRMLFASLLLGFRKHIEKETMKMKQFLIDSLAAVGVASRYTEGALPGLDFAMRTLAVPSPLQKMNTTASHRIETSSIPRLCLVSEFDSERKFEFLEMEEGTKLQCLNFRFVPTIGGDYLLATPQGRPKFLVVRSSPNYEVMLLEANQNSQPTPFRMLGLRGGTSLLAVKKRSQTLYLTRERRTRRVFMLPTPFCAIDEIDLLSWTITSEGK